MLPQVSIIVPCYNQAAFLNNALKSVFEQTFSNWECIIINDGSEDNTGEIAKTWIARDERFLYSFQKNSGVSSARNKGIAVAKGEFILPLDADDIIKDTYLEKAMKRFEEAPSLKLVYCKAEKFGKINEEWVLSPFSLKNLARGNQIFNSAIFRKIEWEKVGGYDINLLYGYEDWDFWISILKNGGEVYQIPEFLFQYRTKDSSRNSNIEDWQFQRIYTYLSKKHGDFFVDQIGSFQTLLVRIKELKDENKNLLRENKSLKRNVLLKILRKMRLF